MRESVGVLGITQIVIFFILLFTGYLCMSINQTKAYNVKNEIINIIQTNNGLNEEAEKKIVEYMDSVSYRSLGRCSAEDGIGYIKDGDSFRISNDKAMLCINKRDVAPVELTGDKTFPSTAYYKVKVFFSLDIPIIDGMFNFNLIGTTKNIYCPTENEGC